MYRVLWNNGMWEFNLGIRKNETSFQLKPKGWLGILATWMVIGRENIAAIPI